MRVLFVDERDLLTTLKNERHFGFPDFLNDDLCPNYNGDLCIFLLVERTS
jgi:hypothetical protein